MNKSYNLHIVITLQLSIICSVTSCIIYTYVFKFDSLQRPSGGHNASRRLKPNAAYTVCSVHRKGGRRREKTLL